MKIWLASISLMACTCIHAQDIEQDLRLEILSTGEKTLEWQGHLGRSYFIQASPDLTNWTWAPNIEEGADEPMSYEVSSTGDKGFFRLQYTDQIASNLDTADFDGDGLTNEEEITPRARPRYLISGLSPYMQTNPLDADTDHDFLPDAWEIANGTDPTDNGSVDPDNGPLGDVDGDGTSNYDQAMAAAQTAGSEPEVMDLTYPHLPRYAFFSLGTLPDNLGKGINDHGIVLSQGCAYWKCGLWSSLSLSGLDTSARHVSIAINDDDLILGQATEEYQPGSGQSSCGYLWTSLTASPTKAAGGIFTNPDDNYYGSIVSHYLANDGTAHGILTPDDDSTKVISRWALPTGTHAALTDKLFQVDYSGRVEWGVNSSDSQVVYLDKSPLSENPSFDPTHCAIGKNDNGEDIVYAFNTESSSRKCEIYDPTTTHWSPFTVGGLIPSHITGDGIPVQNYTSSFNSLIYLNKQWYTSSQYAPDLPADWNSNSQVKMTTAHGWMLWGNTLNNSSRYAASTPITLRGSYLKSDNTTTENAGVDDFSITATDGGNNAGVENRLWIMVPGGSGHEQKLKFSVPVTSSTPIKMVATGITATASEGLNDEITISTSGNDTTEITPNIQYGLDAQNSLSISQPIGLKVMKHRKVRVRVFRISLKKTISGVDRVILPDIGDAVSGSTTEKQVSTVDIQNFLNDVYKPQLNVEFELTNYPLSGQSYELSWDERPPGISATQLDPGYDRLDVAKTKDADFSKEQKTIRKETDNTPSGCDICLYLVSGSGFYDAGNEEDYNVAGHTDVNDGDNIGYCWVSSSSMPKYNSKGQMLACIAHEIGHRIFGEGHPNSSPGKPTGPAPLIGSNHNLRLMRSGGAFKANPGTLIVKQEWDKADAWLSAKATSAE